MKKLLLAIILCAGFAASTFGQSINPTVWTETDGSPRVSAPTRVTVSNGSLVCVGKRCTLSTGAGGGTPGGSGSELQFRGGASTFSAVTNSSVSGGEMTLADDMFLKTADLASGVYGLNISDNAGENIGVLQAWDSAGAGLGNFVFFSVNRRFNGSGTVWENTVASTLGRSIVLSDAGIRMLVFPSGSTTSTEPLVINDTGVMFSAPLIDSNSNELFKFTATASAVNEFTVANAATGANPNITASGGDSNIGFDFQAKGTGVYRILGTSNQAAELRLLEDTDDGTNYTAFKVGTQSGNVTYTLPTAVGAAGTVLTDAAGNGVLSWASGGGASGLTVGTTTVTSGSAGRVFYETAGNVLGEISTLTSDGTIVTFAPTVTTGTGATSGVVHTANSLTTGTGFNYSSTSITSGSLINIASTSTAGATGVEGLNIAMSGANGTAAQTVTGATIAVTNTNATSGTNIGLALTASGATTANTALNVTAGQIITPNGTSALPAWGFSGANTTGIYKGSTQGGTALNFVQSGTDVFAVGQNSGVGVVNIGPYSFSTAIGSTADLFLRRSAAANLAQGNADAASPVAQTSSVQNVVGGTTDTAGVTRTYAASRGTGTGLGGTHLFQVAPQAASTASTQNALVTALTIDSNVHVIYGGTAPAIGGSCGTSPSIVGTDMAGKVTTGSVAPTSCTVTFNKAFTNAPACTGGNETTSNLLRVSSTTTVLTLAGTMVAGDILSYICSGY